MTGLLGGKSKGTTPSNNNEYQKDIIPDQPYTGYSEDIQKKFLRDDRGTLRVPVENKLEFDALLSIEADFQYSYELFAELVYDRVKNFSKEKHQLYQEQLSLLKEKHIQKELKKEAKRKNR